MTTYLKYFLFLSCLLVITPVYASTQTLTTYYPAPQGNYLNMTVNNALTMGGSAACTCQSGGASVPCSTVVNGSTLVGVTNVGGQLEICDSTGTYSLFASTLWTKGVTSYIYPTTSTEAIAIGSAIDPGFAAGVRLGVTGQETVSGATTIGTPAAPANLTVNGTETVTGILTLSGVPSINSNITIGTGASANTLTVTGLTTLSNGLTVNTAAATLNQGLNVNGAVTDLNNGLSVTGKAAITGATYVSDVAANGIWYCDTPSTQTNCGQLQVAKSGGSYYATYAP